jgi:hypothetical protein
MTRERQRSASFSLIISNQVILATRQQQQRDLRPLFLLLLFVKYGSDEIVSFLLPPPVKKNKTQESFNVCVCTVPTTCLYQP